MPRCMSGADSLCKLGKIANTYFHMGEVTFLAIIMTWPIIVITIICNTRVYNCPYFPHSGLNYQLLLILKLLRMDITSNGHTYRYVMSNVHST